MPSAQRKEEVEEHELSPVEKPSHAVCDQPGCTYGQDRNLSQNSINRHKSRAHGIRGAHYRYGYHKNKARDTKIGRPKGSKNKITRGKIDASSSSTQVSSQKSVNENREKANLIHLGELQGQIGIFILLTARRTSLPEQVVAEWVAKRLALNFHS